MRFIYALAALLVLVFFLHLAFPGILQDDDTRMRVLYLVLMLCFLVGGRASRLRGIAQNKTILYGAIWLGVLLLLVLGYSFRDELGQSRLVAELMPSHVRVNKDGVMTLRASDNGHFFVQAEVNGAPVRFLIDTGASDIVLAPEDAKRAGIDPAPLDYSRDYSTANGMGKGAPVTLGSLTVGSVSLERVPASVNRSEMSESLLGMSFLHRLKGFRVEGNTLVLMP